MTTAQIIRRAVVLVVCLLVGLVVGFVFVVPAMTTSPANSTPTPITDPMSQDLDTMQLSLDYGCSSTGLGDDVIPGGALVWRDGETEHVSFDEGWAVHESGQGGVLLAVCER